jgi:hypothetical protein
MFRGKIWALWLIVAGAALLGGCRQLLSSTFEGNRPATGREKQIATDLTILPYTNGLSWSERAKYYRADEGIHYLPVDLMLALSRSRSDGDEPGDPAPGTTTERMLAQPERMGILPYTLAVNATDEKGMRRKTTKNLDALPVGITVSSGPDYLPMAGINCATCHTSLLAVNGKGLVVDGAPSNFAIDRMVSHMFFSLLSAALNTKERQKVYERFLDNVSDRTKRKLTLEPDHATSKVEAVAQIENTASVDPTVIEKLDPSNLDPNDLDREEDEDPLVAREPTHPAIHSVDLRILRKTLRGYAAALSDEGYKCTSKKQTSLNATCAYPRFEDLATIDKFHFYLVTRALFFLDQTLYAGPSGDDLTNSGYKRSNPWYVTKNLFAHRLFMREDSDDWLHAYRNAPIQTPHIWYAEDYAWIFWSGVTNSLEERNLAQGIALLADFNWKRGPGFLETTVTAKGLDTIVSTWIRNIEAPKWPAEFGAVDAAEAENGRKIFHRECLSCHSPAIQGSPGARGQTILRYCDVGTDGMYTAAQREDFFMTGGAKQTGGDLFEHGLGQLMPSVRRSAYANEKLSPEAIRRHRAGRSPEEWHAPQANAIVAKPLYGVWATAPYLHNGSVRTLSQLLRPESREESFWVGTVVYDNKNLGFLNSSPEAVGLATRVDTEQQGSSNGGHTYGSHLSARERRELLSFLKIYDRSTSFDDLDPSEQNRDEASARCTYRVPRGHPAYPPDWKREEQPAPVPAPAPAPEPPAPEPAAPEPVAPAPNLPISKHDG